MSGQPTTEKERATIILHSGAYDRAAYALSLAQMALALGLEVSMLLTYGGLRRFTRGRLMELGEETEPWVRESVAHGLKTGGIQPLTDRLEAGKKMGLKLYACPAAMADLNIAREDLIAEIDGIMGLGAFLGYARSAAVDWYI